MKIIVPVVARIEILEKQLNFSEVSFIFKDFVIFSNKIIKIDFKKLGFVFVTVKDSVYLKSSVFVLFTNEHKFWLIQKQNSY